MDIKFIYDCLLSNNKLIKAGTYARILGYIESTNTMKLHLYNSEYSKLSDSKEDIFKFPLEAFKICTNVLKIIR